MALDSLDVSKGDVFGRLVEGWRLNCCQGALAVTKYPRSSHQQDSIPIHYRTYSRAVLWPLKKSLSLLAQTRLP